MKVGAIKKGWLKPNASFPRDRIPAHEIDSFVAQIKAHPEYLDPRYMRDAYRSLCAELIADPFDLAVVEKIEAALGRQEPFSVVRIGDGETNILAFGDNRSTPNLDRHAFEKSLANQDDTLLLSELWMLMLRDLFAHAVYAADIIGVLGAWIPNDKPGSTDRFVGHFLKEQAAMAGQWRGRDFMLRWARSGSFASKTLGSAHLYFGVLMSLDRLIEKTKKVVCLSNRTQAVATLAARCGPREFLHLPVGMTGRPRSAPDFLVTIENALPGDLRGCLCLVGAGPWAELYCTWIKQRGGVGIDLGSGFDLLEGEVTRSMHRAVPEGILRELTQKWQ